MSPPASVVHLPKLGSLSHEDCNLLVGSVVDYAIFMVDPQGCIASWNLGAERTNGYSADEIMGQHISTFYTEEDLRAGTAAHVLAAAERHGRTEVQGWRLRKDGGRFWASIVATALRTETGDLRGFAMVTKDCTREWLATQQLRHSEERFHHLIDAVTDYAIFMLDDTGHVLTWNSGAQAIKGYAAHEIIGKHFSQFYTAQDREDGKPARILDTVRREGRYEEEMWRVRKDTSLFWANVVITALRNERGEATGFAKVTRDLTLQRAAAERIRQTDERFHQLVDAVTDYAIFMLAPTGHVMSWNAGAKNIKGYDAAEIIGRHFSQFFTAEDRAAGRPEHILNTVLRVGRFEDEAWRVRKDGSRFWANVVINAMRDEHGRVNGLVKITRDLSERRAREEQLRHSEERFRLLIEAVSDYAIYMLDPHGVVTTWNAGAERMKQYKASEIIGQNFSVFFPSEVMQQGAPARELAVARSEGRFEDEGWRIRKDGSRFWANVIVTAMRDANGELLGFSKITRDLTQRREAEETERRLVVERAARAAAQEVAKRAEEANRIKDEFLATVSHELRTPLNAIVGWAALLRDRELEATVAKGIRVIDRNAQAQVKIVDDILDVSRIITGKLRLELKATDLIAVAKHGIEVVRPSATAKGISIRFDAPTELGLIMGDPERLQQVTWNLLSNAVKFTNPGGAVSIKIERQDTNVVLSVIDTGPGIEPDFLPFVFERFRQADSSSTRRFGGLGLGLAIVRHLIELHGGSVAAASGGPGQGATFSVSIPAAGELAAAAQIPAVVTTPVAALEHGADALAGLRVLVVDDDPDGRELVATVLTRAGAVTETANSAAQGLVAVGRFHPHVVVSDIGMADEDGYSFVRRLRAMDAAGSSIPSIALTAYTRAEDRSKALAAGFTTHLAKPVNVNDLIAAIVNLRAVVAR